MTEPTAEQKLATCNIFKNIIEILKHGMFFGANAGFVAEALGFLDANVKAMEGSVKAADVKLYPAEEPKA